MSVESSDVGFLHWVFGKHPIPPPAPPDPNKVAEVAILPLWETPMIITALDEMGIRATFAEITPMHAKAIQHPTQSAIVYVIETDLARAKEAIAELTAPGEYDDSDDSVDDDDMADEV